MLTILALLTLGACQTSYPDEPAGSGVLVIILDDVGAEHLAFHPMGVEAGAPAPTPTLDGLASSGIQFIDAWSAPSCSPTRAAILTGRFGHRTGVGAIVTASSGFEMPLSEVTLAERMVDRGHTAGLFGKWHLSLDPEDACDQGFELWDGAQRNLSHGACSSSCSYTNWERTIDTPSSPALLSIETGYATTVQVDECLAWVQAEQAAGRTWFSVLALSAAHIPRHAPPAALQPVTGATAASDELTKHRGMVEALDTEIGRLLAGIDLGRTTVFVVGDNGSADDVALAPVVGAKQSVYRGGIEVPFIVVGQYVDRSIGAGFNYAGQQLGGNANVVDVFRTALRLMPGTTGGPWPMIDSRTLYKGGRWGASRPWNFAERFKPLGTPPGGPYTLLQRAIEEDGWKLITDQAGSAELYDVLADPWETVNVLADGVDPLEQAIVDGLMARVAGLGL